jgi:hypothetical protein
MALPHKSGMILLLILPLVLVLSATAAEQSHIRIENPGVMTPAKAEKAYRQILAELAGFYALSKDKAAVRFTSWWRANNAPYLSATHGNRYVNNYANDIAVRAGYGAGKAMAPGAVLAKDSFTVTDDGEVFGAALFLMEKLPSGVSPQTADWRYWMIMPDGSILGDTEDDSAGEVAFCHACHKTVARKDFLFFVPAEFRR